MTFETIKSLIRSWLSIDQEDADERLPDAIVGSIINMVMRDYCRRRESRFGEFSRFLTTVVGTSSYTLPTDWSKPRKIWYIDPVNTSAKVIEPLNKDIFDVTYPDGSLTNQDLTHYTIWSGSIRFGKTPGRVLNIILDYWRILPDLVAGSDNNRFTREAWEYLLFASLVKATEFGIEDDRLPTWTREMEKFEMALDSEDSRALHTGRRLQSQEPG